MRMRWAFIAPLAIVGIVVFLAIGGEVVKLLWNGLLPQLFGWPAVTFWQALGLLALCRILVGGFGLRGGGPRYGGGARFRRRFADRIAERFAERWQEMTPEEREHFRQRVRERCGFDPAGGGGGPAAPSC